MNFCTLLPRLNKQFTHIQSKIKRGIVMTKGGTTSMKKELSRQKVHFHDKEGSFTIKRDRFYDKMEQLLR